MVGSRSVEICLRLQPLIQGTCHTLKLRSPSHWVRVGFFGLLHWRGCTTGLYRQVVSFLRPETGTNFVTTCWLNPLCSSIAFAPTGSSHSPLLHALSPPPALPHASCSASSFACASTRLCSSLHAPFSARLCALSSAVGSVSVLVRSAPLLPPVLHPVPPLPTLLSFRFRSQGGRTASLAFCPLRGAENGGPGGACSRPCLCGWPAPFVKHRSLPCALLHFLI